MAREFIEEFGSSLGPFRIRTKMEPMKGPVIQHWAVQLEWWDPEAGRWIWIARYDTAGGKPHRDRNGFASHEAVDLPKEPGQALRKARQDLLDNAERYIQAFKGGAGRKTPYT